MIRAAHRRSLFIAAFIAAALTLAGCMKPNPLAEALLDVGDETDETDAGESGPLPDFSGTDGECATVDEPGMSSMFSMACVTCLSGSCCDSATLCADVQPCACLVACNLGGGAPGTCKNQCDAKPEDHPEVALLLACANGSCADAC
jgi:hypothetical protein